MAKGQRCKTLLLLAASTTLSLGIAELGLMLFWPQATYNRSLASGAAIFAPSDTMPYALAPNSSGQFVMPEFVTPIQINALGYRDDEFTLEKRDAFRVLAIGDSFTFGYTGPLSESYPDQLESLLQKKLKTDRVEVINAGFAACYYPDTYYLYLKERGLALKPDVIVIGFFIGNDIDHDLVDEHAWTRTDDQGLPLSIDGVYIKVENGYCVAKQKRRRYRLPVVRHSHVAQLLASVVSSLRHKQEVYFNHYVYRRQYLPRTDEAVTKVKKLLTAISDLASDRNIPLLVMLIPTREQVYPEAYPFDDFEELKDIDLDKPQRIFNRFFQEQAIAHLDVLPLMRQHAGTEVLYFPQDAHWNKRGNQLASQTIAADLSKRGWLPSSPAAAP